MPRQKASSLIVLIAVVGLVVMLVVPLPTAALDLLLACNISGSLLILLVRSTSSARPTAATCSTGASLRRKMAMDSGVLLPLVRIRDDLDLPMSTYSIQLGGVGAGCLAARTCGCSPSRTARSSSWKGPYASC